MDYTWTKGLELRAVLAAFVQRSPAVVARKPMVRTCFPLPVSGLHLDWWKGSQPRVYAPVLPMLPVPNRLAPPSDKKDSAAFAAHSFLKQVWG